MSYLDDFLMQLHLQGVFGPNSMSANQMQQQQPQQLPINTFNPNLIGRAGYGVDPQWSAPDPLPVNQFNPQMFGQQQNYGNEYKPKTEMNDRFAALLDQFPERTEQGILKKIAIALSAGFGSGGDIGQAAQAAEIMKNAGFNRQLNDWKNKIVPVQQAADNERLSNAQERMYFDQAGRIRQSERKQEEVERAAKIREDQGQQKIDIAAKKQEVDAFKVNNPTWRAVSGKGGTVHFVNPMDPTQIIDTKLPTGTLTDMERMKLQLDNDLVKMGQQNENVLGQIGARGQVQSELIDQRTDAQKELIPLRTAGQIEVKKTVPGANPRVTGTGTVSATQRIAEEGRRARQALSEHPEWTEYIGFDDKNKFIRTRLPAGGYFSKGGSQQILDAVNKYIYGDTAPALMGSREGSTIPATNPPNTNIGRVQVIGPNGEKGTVSAEDAKSLPTGWKVIR